MSKILGLDLGPNSIGWSLINPDKPEIIGTGTRIFQEGLNRKGGQEESKNATRRSARGSRRLNARKNARQNKLKYILQESSILPESVFEFQNIMNKNPYELRAKGLDQKLSLHEFGRTLYHINQRRGFKSNRKTNSKEDNKMYKGKDGIPGIDETRKAMVEDGFRTLGEYLNSLNPHEEHQRNRYTERAMYIDEFNKLWDKQAEFHHELRDSDLKKDVFEAIFFQRRLKSQKHTVKYCTFEKNRKVAPKSSPTFQYFRILEQLSRIRIDDRERHNSSLAKEEHEILFTELMHREKMDFKQIAKKLCLSDGYHINLQSQNNLKGHTTFAKLSKAVGKKEWNNLSDNKKFEIWHTLHFYNDPPDIENWFHNHMKDKWEFNDKQIEKLLKVSLEKDYAQLSKKAMEKIIPYLKMYINDKPTTYDAAVILAGVQRALGLNEILTDELIQAILAIHRSKKDSLDEIDKLLTKNYGIDEINHRKLYHHSNLNKYKSIKDHLEFPPNLRNPLVQQSLFELRTVVNDIIEKYGKPEIIRVELARDTKNPKWKRKAMLTLNKRRNEEIEKIKERLIKEHNFSAPSREDLLKYQLWEECNRTCPFTGKKISISELFSNQYQIEHIIPYSRSLDDSQANKTLCYWKENQIKHNKTPYEAYGHDEKRYEEILDRVSKFQNVDRIVKISPEWGKIINGRNYKINKFKQKKIDDDFIARQLVDTAYISREVSKYLQQICDKVFVTSGRTTGKLRHYWGLNDILSGDIDIKQREDHRHHAVDALVIANTTPSFVNTMSRYHKYDRTPKEGMFPMPWDLFHQDAEKAIKNILVSFKVNNRARGQLHEETNYGRIMLPNGTETYVVRKPIDSLTPNQILHIVDGQVKQVLLDRLISLGIDVGGKFTIPKEAWNEPLYLKENKNPIKKVRVAVPTQDMLQLYKNKNLYVEYGKNHHMEIFEDQNGKRIGRTVSMYEAVQRKKHNQPIIDKTPSDDDYKFVMSLAINELVLLDIEESQIDWKNPLPNKDLSTQLFRLQKMDVNKNLTFRHHTVSISNDDTGRVINNPNTMKGVKVSIDSLGNVRPIIS